MKKYSDETKKKVFTLRYEGHSYSSISQELGISEITIAQWVRREAADYLKRAKRLRTNIRHISNYY